MTVTATTFALPQTSRGRKSAAAQARYAAEVLAWCEAIQEYRSRLDFEVSSRGWCYAIEDHGLDKGDFDKAEKLINDCRKDGRLPLDICAADVSRDFDGIEKIDEADPEEEAGVWVDALRTAYERYTPRSFWAGERYYLQLLVEKVDLKSLFADICNQFRIPRANAKGWSDLNSRAAMMRRFQSAENRGHEPVLLYTGDHDPQGLLISDTLRSNMAELAGVVGWSPDNLIIDRFGLNRDFIDRHHLTWIDNLFTGSGKNLADPDHPDHFKPYVQEYIAAHGKRKVEANALIARPKAGRQLLLDTIAKYVPLDAPEQYEHSLQAQRAAFRVELARQVRAMVDDDENDDQGVDNRET